MQHAQFLQRCEGAILQLIEPIETQVELVQLTARSPVLAGEVVNEIVGQGEISQSNEIDERIRMNVFDAIVPQDQPSAEETQMSECTCIERPDSVVAQLNFVEMATVEVVRQEARGEILRIDAGQNGEQRDDHRLMDRADVQHDDVIGWVRSGDFFRRVGNNRSVEVWQEVVVEKVRPMARRYRIRSGRLFVGEPEELRRLNEQ